MMGKFGKVCAKCEQWKAWSEFYRGSAKGGHHRWCKACHREYNREKYAARKGEAYRERQQKPERATPDFTEKDYPDDSILNNWPKGEDGRLLMYWQLDD